MSENTISAVKIIKPSYLLRAKIGTGTISQKIFDKCKRIFDFNSFDFAPLALDHLADLERILEDARSKKLTRNEVASQMTDTVMQLKANAGMFNYHLVGRLATIMLGFLESMKEIDDNALEIVAAHHKTLKAIVVKKMRGDGGLIGKKLEDELKSACQRYFKSKQIP